jgi:hypothetical protein
VVKNESPIRFRKRRKSAAASWKRRKIRPAKWLAFRATVFNEGSGLHISDLKRSGSRLAPANHASRQSRRRYVNGCDKSLSMIDRFLRQIKAFRLLFHAGGTK